MYPSYFSKNNRCEMPIPAIIIHLTAAMAILIIVGCATLPKDFDRPESYVLTDTEDP